MREIPDRESHLPAGAGGRRRANRAVIFAQLTFCIAALTACTSGPADKESAGGHGRNARGTGHKGPSLVLSPAANATGASIIDPVTATANSAVLDTVTLTDAQGRQVPGVVDAKKRTWHSTAPLGYDSSYTLTAAATTPSKQRLTQASQFTTVKPAKLTTPRLLANRDRLLTDRPTFGVGQPIVVDFGEPVTDRATAEGALEVVTDPHVDGAWHWMSDHEVHWRPPEYWKPGTKVTVKTHAYGKHLGDGLYTKDEATASFNIGPSKIAIADDKTFHIQVLFDGKEVRNIPTAMGRHESIGSIDLRTRSGPHVVLGNERVTRMTSASFGLTGSGSYDAMVEWTTHISYEGEYVHAAPWSVWQQGRSDASHGCVNINTENAIWFHDNFGPGDVVDVRNTGITLAKTDGLGDWTLSWDDWLKGSALSPPPTPARVN
jgi:lipoprotein-anchoring transpeptidase ErfK/SrfK